MTNKEKAMEIIIKKSNTKQVLYDINDDVIPSLDVALREDLMQMAKWKDEQFKAEKQALIDKACEWLNTHDNYSTPTHVLVEQLRQAMKGGKQ